MRALLLVILVASPVAAEPRFAGGIDYTVARGGHMADVELGWRLEAGLFARIGRFQITPSLSGLMKTETDRPERDSGQLFGIGYGARVAYHHRIERNTDVLVAIGFEHVSLTGNGEVRRDCSFTGTCLAGFYMEQPRYHAWAPQLRVGIGPALEHPDMLIGLTFEIIVEPITFPDVPPSGMRGIAVYGAMNVSLGWGRKHWHPDQNL